MVVRRRSGAVGCHCRAVVCVPLVSESVEHRHHRRHHHAQSSQYQYEWLWVNVSLAGDKQDVNEVASPRVQNSYGDFPSSVMRDTPRMDGTVVWGQATKTTTGKPLITFPVCVKVSGELKGREGGAACLAWRGVASRVCRRALLPDNAWCLMPDGWRA